MDTPSCDQWQGVSRSNSRTSRNSANPGGSVSIREKAVQRPQLQAGSLSSPSTKKLEARRESPLTTAGGQPHPHWCTVCQTPSLIKTCDGWKRHEKEQHEKGYLCMPNGPIEATETGRYCAFCGQPNPDQKHLDIHGTELCTGKTMKDRRYTRRFQLVKHLETHGIFEDSNLADHLADSWQIKLRNRYYSCGFCVSLFPSNGERLNHIDSYHFRRFESIDRWSPNMVIRGLLLQPAVLACWKEISTYDIHNANLVWEPEVIANLQPRLEISDEPAHQLATHAFYNSSLGLDSSPSLMTFLPRAGDPQTATSQQARFGREDSELTQGTRPGLNFFINTPEQASQMPAPSLPWNVAAVEPMDIDQLEIHPPQALTDYSCEGPTYGFVYNQSTLPLSPSDASTDIPRQPQHYPYTDPNLDTLDARNSMVPSQRQPSTVGSWRSSSLASTNTSIQSFPAPLPDRQYFVPAGRNYQSFSAHQSIPSLSTASINAYAHKKSPSFVAQLKRRLSRVKLRDASAEPDVPMDIDLDKLMRCMEHSQQSRTEIKHHHEVSHSVHYGVEVTDWETGYLVRRFVG